mmetsp:Transcript_6491/g.22348  ORF Transcript_6491/g.22348 Transcript_6491/m.22348 type:complete len:330 (-) Transcript_6491:47-1036(-)
MSAAAQKFCAMAVARAAPLRPIPRPAMSTKSRAQLRSAPPSTTVHGVTLSRCANIPELATITASVAGAAMARVLRYATADGTSDWSATMRLTTPVPKVSMPVPITSPHPRAMKIPCATARPASSRLPLPIDEATTDMVLTPRLAKAKLQKLKIAVLGPSAASSIVEAYRPTQRVSTNDMMGSARGMTRAGPANAKIRASVCHLHWFLGRISKERWLSSGSGREALSSRRASGESSTPRESTLKLPTSPNRPSESGRSGAASCGRLTRAGRRCLRRGRSPRPNPPRADAVADAAGTIAYAGVRRHATRGSTEEARLPPRRTQRIGAAIPS